MGALPARLVYLGNLLPVAEALAGARNARVAACVIEAGDETGGFAAFAARESCGLFVVKSGEELARALRSAGIIDLGVVANFGLILSAAHRASARLGFINAHLGLLPERPGRHPIRAAIAAGDAVASVTLHRVTADVDRGPVLDRRIVPLTRGASGADVLDRLSALAARMVAERVALEIGG